MEQIPCSESNRFSDGQKIPRVLWNPKVYYGVYKSPPPFFILSPINPVHASLFYFLKIRFNIIHLCSCGLY